MTGTLRCPGVSAWARPPAEDLNDLIWPSTHPSRLPGVAARVILTSSLSAGTEVQRAVASGELRSRTRPQALLAKARLLWWLLASPFSAHHPLSPQTLRSGNPVLAPCSDPRCLYHLQDKTWSLGDRPQLRACPLAAQTQLCAPPGGSNAHAASRPASPSALALPGSPAPHAPGAAVMQARGPHEGPRRARLPVPERPFSEPTPRR